MQAAALLQSALQRRQAADELTATSVNISVVLHKREQ